MDGIWLVYSGEETGREATLMSAESVFLCLTFPVLLCMAKLSHHVWKPWPGPIFIPSSRRNSCTLGSSAYPTVFSWHLLCCCICWSLSILEICKWTYFVLKSLVYKQTVFLWFKIVSKPSYEDDLMRCRMYLPLANVMYPCPERTVNVSAVCLWLLCLLMQMLICYSLLYLTFPYQILTLHLKCTARNSFSFQFWLMKSSHICIKLLIYSLVIPVLCHDPVLRSQASLPLWEGSLMNGSSHRYTHGYCDKCRIGCLAVP